MGKMLSFMIDTKFEAYESVEDATLMFKGIFKNFGPLFLPSVLPHVLTMLDATTEEGNNHLVASQILGGALRAMKSWDYQNLALGRQLLEPVVKKAFAKASNETLSTWSHFVRYVVVSSRCILPLYEVYVLILSAVFFSVDGQRRQKT